MGCLARNGDFSYLHLAAPAAKDTANLQLKVDAGVTTG